MIEEMRTKGNAKQRQRVEDSERRVNEWLARRIERPEAGDAEKVPRQGAAPHAPNIPIVHCSAGVAVTCAAQGSSAAAAAAPPPPILCQGNVRIFGIFDNLHMLPPLTVDWVWAAENNFSNIWETCEYV